MDKVAAIIPAAGQGKRMGLPYNKQFVELNGVPAVYRTISIFHEHPLIETIIVICAAGEEGYFSADKLSSYGITCSVKVVTGGKERQDSVYNGLRQLPTDCRYVLIHDGVRPMVTTSLISDIIQTVQSHPAVVTGVPVKDTIKKTDEDGFISETVPRDRLWHIQTPQAFETKMLLNAYEQAFTDGFYGTDDASLVERIGVPVKLVQGSYENIKVTTPEDIILAETFLKRRGHP